MSVLRVGLVQHDIVWEDREATLDHVGQLVDKAAAEGARLVVLTELFPVGFSMNTDLVAEAEGGPTSTWMAARAAEHGVWIGGSVPEVAESEVAEGRSTPANTFVLAGPDGTAARYRKVHTFTYAGEHEHYASGDTEVTVDVEGVRVTPFVCYDLRFADRWWNRAASTDLYVCVASWPSARAAHWRTLLPARAIENQAYVAGVNRVGSGGGIDYSGDSLLIAPFGEVLLDGAGGEEGVLVADVDSEVVATVRRDYPFLADR